LNAAASAMTFEACVEKALTLKSSLPKDTGSHCTVVGAGRGVDARIVYILSLTHVCAVLFLERWFKCGHHWELRDGWLGEAL
jgi:hypothetical protein